MYTLSSGDLLLTSSSGVWLCAINSDVSIRVYLYLVAKAVAKVVFHTPQTEW